MIWWLDITLLLVAEVLLEDGILLWEDEKKSKLPQSLFMTQTN